MTNSPLEYLSAAILHRYHSRSTDGGKILISTSQGRTQAFLEPESREEFWKIQKKLVEPFADFSCTLKIIGSFPLPGPPILLCSLLLLKVSPRNFFPSPLDTFRISDSSRGKDPKLIASLFSSGFLGEDDFFVSKAGAYWFDSRSSIRSCEGSRHIVLSLGGPVFNFGVRFLLFYKPHRPGFDQSAAFRLCLPFSFFLFQPIEKTLQLSPCELIEIIQIALQNR